MNKLKLAALALLCASVCQAASVTIAESTYSYANGSRVTGTITVSWPAFSTGTTSIAAGSIQSSITAGVLSIALEANDTADPPMFYTATFRTARGSYSQQWVVPSVAGPLTISDVVRVSLSPITITLSQISKVGAVAGDIGYYNGTNWVRLPRGTNGQVLSVDTSLVGKLKWGAASGTSVWGGITGTLSDQTDLASALAAKLAAANNLSDLASASTARTNLGLGTAAVSAASAFEPAITAGTSLQVWLGSKAFATLNTAMVPELTNLYFTNARAQSAMSGLYENPLTFSLPLVRTVNAISIQAASASQNGYLSSVDWNTFNGKQAALGFTPPANTLTISTTGPLAGGGDLSANRTLTCPTCVTSAAALTADKVIVGAGSQASVASTCTKTTGQPLTCADGFSTGGVSGPGTYYVDIGADGGAGYIRLKAASAISGEVVPTFPAPGGTVMYTSTSVLSAQLPALIGDATSSAGSAATTVGKINGVSLAGLATGVLCNTTGTGVPSICNAASLPAHASRHQNGGNDEVASATAGSGVIPKAGSTGKLAAGFIPFLGLGALPGATFQSWTANNAASGNVDLYTVPPNKRALVTSLSCYNTAGTTTTVISQIKISAAYYRLAANLGIATNAVGNPQHNIFFDTGESVSINTSQAGLNCFLGVVEYPNTIPAYSPKLTTLANGNNTVYTVPASTNALSMSVSNFVPNPSGSFASSAGGTFFWNIVNSGGSPGSTNQATPSTVTGGNSVSAQTPHKTGNSGDFVVFNITTASGSNIVWLNVVELPN